VNKEKRSKSASIPILSLGVFAVQKLHAKALETPPSMAAKAVSGQQLGHATVTGTRIV